MQGKYHHRLLLFALLVVLGLSACKNEQEELPEYVDQTPYELEIPGRLPPMVIPTDNPLTVEGVKLGRHLFYDPILSLDSTISCGSCHHQELGFSDAPFEFSQGVYNLEGTKNAMALINLGYANEFFWDGRATGLPHQAEFPVEDPLEMLESWPRVLKKLSRHPEYPAMFKAAFGNDDITVDRVTKAITQFEMTLISGNSKYDKFLRREPGGDFSQEEFNGYVLFFQETGGDCFHCHTEDLMTTNGFSNNGLDSVFTESNWGLFKVTGDSNDLGKFKVPTLRNIELTAPYMHDGRFETLEEVLDHYNEHVQVTPTTDPLLYKPTRSRLTQTQKNEIIAYLKTLTDTTFINNPAFSNPFE